MTTTLQPIEQVITKGEIHMLSSRSLTGLIISATLLSGCASSPQGVQHGMAPSSTGPKPDWYVQEYGLPRGVGEALRRDRLSLWDQKTGTYTYTVRGQIYAQFHPWEHFLKIRPDNGKTFANECQWSAEGVLNNTRAEEIKPNVAERCGALINQLAQELDVVVE
jgi:hypothetical protein